MSSFTAAAQTLLLASLLLFPPILFHLFKQNLWLLANLQNRLLIKHLVKKAASYYRELFIVLKFILQKNLIGLFLKVKAIF